jgi:putative oxidoreductase
VPLGHRWHEGYCDYPRVPDSLSGLELAHLPDTPVRPMSPYSVATEKNIDRAMLVLRLVLASIFITHGYQKVFVFGLSGVAGSFEQMGVPLASIVGPCIAILEFGGGFALLFGVFTRVIAFLLACDMLGAMIFVHAKNGFAAPKGIENVLGNFGMLVTVALLGAGAYSIDAMLARRGKQTP